MLNWIYGMFVTEIAFTLTRVVLSCARLTKPIVGSLLSCARVYVAKSKQTLIVPGQ